jgi:DNA (cytosine-5)-methyltransferase 1
VDTSTFRVLSLCSGIGGLDLGLRLAVPSARTVVMVEREAYCCALLAARMQDGFLDDAPIWTDAATFSGRAWRGAVDCVIGGYPCQPFSVAGRRAGADDPRHLWPHIARILGECEPEWCFFENVAGHLTLGFDVVARELEAMGYRVAAGLFTAAEVGAPHRRQRLYILARRQQRDSLADAGCVGEYANEPRWRRGSRGPAQAVFGGSSAAMAHASDDHGRPGVSGAEAGVGSNGERRGRPSVNGAAVGDTDDARLEGWRVAVGECADELPAWPPGPEEWDRWADVLAVRPELAPAVADADNNRRAGAPVHLPVWRKGEGVSNIDGPSGRVAATETSPQPVVRGVAHGLPHRVDRLKALGNTVVPAAVALAWRSLQRELDNAG